MWQVSEGKSSRPSEKTTRPRIRFTTLAYPFGRPQKHLHVCVPDYIDRSFLFSWGLCHGFLPWQQPAENDELRKFKPVSVSFTSYADTSTTCWRQIVATSRFHRAGPCPVPSGIAGAGSSEWKLLFCKGNTYELKLYGPTCVVGLCRRRRSLWTRPCGRAVSWRCWSWSDL